MKKHYLHRAVACALSSACLLGLLSGCRQQPSPAVPIITEAMNRNRTVLADENGTYSDWIEIYNPGTTALSLDGYTLSDNEKAPRKWAFPEGTVLEPGGYLLVFCSGANETEAGELHANFRISRMGETIFLCNPGGSIASQLEIPELPEDVSCGYRAEDTENLVYYVTPTPGEPNSPDALTDLSQRVYETYDLRINEYTDQNQFQFYDQDGDCPSWAEIYNYGQESVNLGGMSLSDDPGNLNKWQFPKDLILEPGQYLLVYLSGKDRFSQGELHTDFSLGSRDTHLILSASGQRIIDSVEITHMEGNASYGRLPEDPTHWGYFARPTPGAENTTSHFDSLSAANSLTQRQVWINEAMSVSGQQDFYVYDSDWIELYNGSQEDVDLTGYTLSDSQENFANFTFPHTVLAPGEYLVLSANGQQPTPDTPYQLPFRLAAAGETLYLMRPDGTLCDRFETGRQLNGLSSGRGSGDTDLRLFFKEPTPGSANADGCPGYTTLPVFSSDSLYVKSGDTISLSGEGEIHYTTDGSIPTEDSPLYEAPIAVTKNMSIRAASFAEGLISGGVATHTYLVDAPHDLPVVCLSTTSANLFDKGIGIYSDGYNPGTESPHYNANYWRPWERPIHFAFYESDGTLGIQFDAGIQIFGQYSREVPQKSMSIHLREGYGLSEVRYPFFRNNPVTEYHDLLLRSSGQDWSSTKLRDALTHMIVKDVTDIDLMDYQPVALYINGRYWGLYNLRDKVNEQYLYTHRGVDPDNVDVIKSDSFAQSGDMEAYYDLMNYLRTHDLSEEENFRYIESIVDVEEVMDYWITETFFANTDTGNIKIYRERSPEGKWRLILYDLDWALFPDSYHWNMLRAALNPEGHGTMNAFPTTLLRGLLKNEGCRQAFIQRYAYHLNTTFAPERTISILHEMAAAIESEIPMQYSRWNYPSPESWAKDIAFLEKALVTRVEESKEDLQFCFDLTDEEMQALFPEG